MMYVTLLVAENAESTQEFRDVLKSAELFGLHLRCISKRPNTRPYYAAEVTDESTARRFLVAVAQSSVLDAAYLKPSDDPPV